MVAERKYDRNEWVPKICDRLAEGETLSAICQKEGIPRRTVNGWRQEDGEIAKQFKIARAEFIETHADACIEIADNESTEQGAVQRDKLRIWTRMQLIARCDNAKKAEQQANPEGPKLDDPDSDIP